MLVYKEIKKQEKKLEKIWSCKKIKKIFQKNFDVGNKFILEKFYSRKILKLEKMLKKILELKNVFLKIFKQFWSPARF